jgi:ankyrin repeat protein
LFVGVKVYLNIYVYIHISMVAPIVTFKILQQAIAAGNINKVKKILKMNHLPAEYPNPLDGKPLFFYAIDYHQPNILAYLLSCVDESNHTDFVGNTCVLQAVGAGNLEALQLVLIRYPQQVGTPNNAGMTPLLNATRGGNIELIKALLLAGANVDDQDREGSSALLLAAAYGRFDIVLLLVQSIRLFIIIDKANINILNNKSCSVYDYCYSTMMQSYM